MSVACSCKAPASISKRDKECRFMVLKIVVVFWGELKKLMKLKFRLRLRRQPKKLKDDTIKLVLWQQKLLSFNFPKRA